MSQIINTAVLGQLSIKLDVGTELRELPGAQPGMKRYEWNGV